MTRFAKVATFAIASVVVLAMGSVAHAKEWGPRTSSYRDTVRVEASGNFYNSAGTGTSVVTVKDRSNDGNSVHATTRFYQEKFGLYHGSTYWAHYTTKSTVSFENTTKTRTLRQAYPASSVDGPANRMRGSITACAQMGWPVPDNCTDPAVITVNY